MPIANVVARVIATDKSGVMGELCRIIRLLGSGIILVGERSGLQTRTVTESVSSFVPMKH
jgi:hypothetical protein